MSLRRIHTDLQEAREAGKWTGIRIVPHGEDMFHLRATLRGPPTSPYKGGLFELDLCLPADYPFKAPKVVFVTPIVHPFVSVNGAIGLNILNGTDWCPAWNLHSVLLAVQALLGSMYDGGDTMNAEASLLYQTNRAAFYQAARFWTEAYALPNAVDDLCTLFHLTDRTRVQKALEENDWDAMEATMALFADEAKEPLRQEQTSESSNADESTVSECGSSYVQIDSVVQSWDAARLKSDTHSEDSSSLAQC